MSGKVKLSKPSLLFMGLRYVVSRGLLKRGYGRLLRWLPAIFWGGKSLVVETEVGAIALPIGNTSSNVMALFGKLMDEIPESLVISKLSSYSTVMIDVGTHLGWYSLLMSREMKNGQVYSFEPNPQTFPYLQENVRRRKGIFPFELVVGEFSGTSKFYLSPDSGRSSAVRRVGTGVSRKATNLDNFCQENQLVGKVDFIKCDVEGAEVDVLRGARQVRSAACPPIWMIEIDEAFLGEAGTSADEANREILSGVRSRMHLFYLSRDGQAEEIFHVSERQGTSNIFLVPEERLDQFLSSVKSNSGS